MPCVGNSKKKACKNSQEIISSFISRAALLKQEGSEPPACGEYHKTRRQEALCRLSSLHLQRPFSLKASVEAMISLQDQWKYHSYSPHTLV